ncbi:putative purine permease 4 [Curcuma longa]|uniref:putative purine permease 4 n=1 Tax=Curcuma longa TaxID=136217 RepID=UPI003D9DED5D
MSHYRSGEIRPLTTSVSAHRLLVLCFLVVGVNIFFIEWGASYLPVSTSSLLLSSQLAFTLLLSVLLVRQPIRVTNVSCILCSRSDAPPGTSHSYFTLRDLRHLPSSGSVDVPPAASSGAVRSGWGVQQTARELDIWAAWYLVTIAETMVNWKLCFMGTAQLAFLTSSTNSGTCTTAMLAVNVVGEGDEGGASGTTSGDPDDDRPQPNCVNRYKNVGVKEDQKIPLTQNLQRKSPIDRRRRSTVVVEVSHATERSR